MVESIEDHIHVQVRKIYPDAELPSFKIIDKSSECLSLLYKSERSMYMFAKALMEKKISVFGGDQWRPLLHVKDVANAIDQTVDTSLNGIYNLHYKNYKIIDIAEKIKEKIGDVEIDITPMSFEDARNYQVSSEKLEGESKFKAEIGLEQGIDEIYELILNNRIKDINDPRYSNQNFLKEHGVS